MLRISKMADYGVVIMTLIATLRKPLVSATEIGERTHLTVTTVSKLLKRLVRHGLLKSQRGITGGYSLALEAGRISLADVIEAIDGPISMTECSTPHKPCKQASTCHLQHNWKIVNNVVHQALKDVSLIAMNHALHEQAFVVPVLVSEKGTRV